MSATDDHGSDPVAAPVAASAIAQYYDSNTGPFLALGGSGEVAAIHRAIYAPGVQTRAQAFNYLNACVAQAIKPCIESSHSQVQAQVLDLGCGVGGTSTWLAQTLAVGVTGITISAAQQKLATGRAQQLGLGHRCRFIQADFAAMPDLPTMDAAFAIESFVHAGSADSFFAMAARQLRSGGRLVICDDFLAPRNPPQAHKWVKRFERGWHLNNLGTLDHAIAAAARHGLHLINTEDLSAFVPGFYPPLLWLMRHLTRLPLPWPYWHNLAGGTALQYCIKQGWTRYHVLILEKSA